MFSDFRIKVKATLKDRNLTYAQLSEIIHMEESTIKSFMCGANDSRRVAERIADALNWELIYSNNVYTIKDKEESYMAKLRIIDTKDRFLVEVDGTEIPYVTTYELTRTVGDIVLLKLALSVIDPEVEIETDKVNIRKQEETT